MFHVFVDVTSHRLDFKERDQVIGQQEEISIPHAGAVVLVHFLRVDVVVFIHRQLRLFQCAPLARKTGFLWFGKEDNAGIYLSGTALPS